MNFLPAQHRRIPRLRSLRLSEGFRSYGTMVAVSWMIAMLPAAHYLYRQAAEHAVVKDYLAAQGLAGLPRTKPSALRIAQQVRADFNVDERRFRVLNLSQRPFLREDAEFLLRHKEGQCGEGTRVIVNLLLHEGYDATRVTLYDRRLAAVHTLVSITLDGKEVLVDSINSGKETADYLMSRDVSTRDFGHVMHSEDLSERHAAAARPLQWHANDPFFEQHWLFSYEATPITKLLHALGWKGRAFNFDRPSRTISSIAEKPNLVKAIAAFLGALFVLLLAHASGGLRALYRRMNSANDGGQRLRS